MKSLEAYDPSVAVQAVAVCRQRGIDLSVGAGRQAVESASPGVKQAITAYFTLLRRERE
jgi:hypothetical protein